MEQVIRVRTMAEKVGFVSTRFAGNDGVSLESAKWAEVFWSSEHISYWYGGKLDRHPDVSHCVPEAFFDHPENVWINRHIWGRRIRSARVNARIRKLTDYLKISLDEFCRKFSLSFLVVENALTIPMHVPFGLAITEYLHETAMPSIVHHHDFYWERDRFSVNAVSDYLDMAFPPRLEDVQHAVINESAREQLSWRKGVPATLVPNVLNFEQPPSPPDSYCADVREQIGLGEEDIMILQPTRVIPRKGIEHSIDLVEELGDPRYKLVISHEAGDEGMEYADTVHELAAKANVDLRIVSTRIGEFRHLNSKGQKVYTLWDLYQHADLVTYPSLYEGFGNAFLEAIYYRVPMVVNRYSIFTRDIEPKGFQVVVMDGIITQKVVEEVRRVLENRTFRDKMVDHNYALAERFYSYSVLHNKLDTLISNVKGI